MGKVKSKTWKLIYPEGYEILYSFDPIKYEREKIIEEVIKKIDKLDKKLEKEYKELGDDYGGWVFAEELKKLIKK